MFTIEILADAEIVHVADDLDGVTHAGLFRTISACEARARSRVVLSLLSCRYVDAQAISIILRASKRMGNRFFTVVALTGACRKMFEVTGVASRSFVVPTIAEALYATQA